MSALQPDKRIPATAAEGRYHGMRHIHWWRTLCHLGNCRYFQTCRCGATREATIV